MKKFVCLFVVFVMLLGCVFTVNAASYTGMINADGIIATGDFNSLTEGFFVYAPAELADSEEKYPVAVWANGTFCAPVLYNELLIGVAKAGYIVVASPEMMAGDGTMQIAAVDYILAENEDENSIFYNRVDVERIAAFGQSQGGLGSVNAAVSDDRIRAVVSIAGSSTAGQASGLKVPTLFLTGTNDRVVDSAEWVEPSYNACRAPAVYASLKDGTHTSFIFEADEYINYTVKWFNAWLYADGDKSVFEEDGELANDPDWTDVRVKNFDGSAEGNVAEESNRGFAAFFRQLITRIKSFFAGLFG